MYQYLNLLKEVLENGKEKFDRTGIGTKSIFGSQMKFNLNDGFPILTTKNYNFKSIVYELLWFLKGDTNISYLNENGVSIWNEWADKNGDLGPVYGKQWRSWETSDGRTIDQISDVINQIRKDSNSRRLIVSAWNPSDIKNMALPPCHCLFQFYVIENKLSCKLYQRSADVFLGVPFNIASYALLTIMIARICKLDVGEFIHSFGDVHLYLNHIDQAKEQLLRKPMNLPKLNIINAPESIFDFKYENFELINYNSAPNIKAPIAI